MPEKSQPRREPALKVAMMPRDTNVHNTIFGGLLLSYIDLAGAAHCRSEHLDRCVTIAMNEVVFKHAVFVGDIVSLFCETIRIGRTSITVKVDVWAERFEQPRQCVWVTEAEVTYVNVDHHRKPIPIIPDEGGGD